MSFGADRNTRVRAYMAVMRAVKSGRLTKPSACPECGRADRRIQAHHHLGYDQPLEVMWLCLECHTKKHWLHLVPFSEITFEDYRHKPSPLTAFLRGRI